MLGVGLRLATEAGLGVTAGVGLVRVGAGFGLALGLGLLDGAGLVPANQMDGCHSKATSSVDGHTCTRQANRDTHQLLEIAKLCMRSADSRPVAGV